MHTYQVIEAGKPLQKASKALILLHGRGSTAEDILSLGDVLGDSETYFAAPQATHNTWYPYTFLAERSTNEPWLSSALDLVKQIILQISKTLPSSQIAIAGFSQGACLALEATARFPQRYKGIAAFTGGLIGKTLSPVDYQGDFHQTPIFIGTSDPDPHVPLGRVKESKAILEQLNAHVELKVYPNLGHTIDPDELRRAKAIL